MPNKEEKLFRRVTEQILKNTPEKPKDRPLIVEHPGRDIALMYAQPGSLLTKLLAPSMAKSFVNNLVEGNTLAAFTPALSIDPKAALALGQEAKAANKVAPLKRATSTKGQEVIYRHPENPNVTIIKNETEGGPGGEGFFTVHLDPGINETVPKRQLIDLAHEVDKLPAGSVISANGMSLDGMKALVQKGRKPGYALARFEGESLPIVENFGTELEAKVVGNPAVEKGWRTDRFNNFAQRIGIDKVDSIDNVPWYALIKMQQGGILHRK